MTKTAQDIAPCFDFSEYSGRDRLELESIRTRSEPHACCRRARSDTNWRGSAACPNYRAPWIVQILRENVRA